MFTKVYEKVKDVIKENYKSFLIIIITLIICLYELPFVIYTPGGIVPLESRIEIEDSYDSKGSLNMSYVTLRKGTLPNILFSYLFSNWDLIDKDEITSDGESVNDLLKLEKLYMDSSIDNATIVAYNKAKDAKINVTENKNNIVYIDSEAKTDLQKYDILLKVDGKKVKNVDELKAIINEKSAGDTIKLEVKRDGKIKECSAEIYDSSDGLKIGVAFLTTYEYETNPQINVKTKSSESGSSGGLMLTLAIYNKLTEEDITKGARVVGTGTIDIEGNVGAIDGVKYKILGAVKKKADLFLCPVDNYEEALKVKEEFDLDIPIKSVATFDEALNYLEEIS